MPAHRVRDDGHVRYWTRHQQLGKASEHACGCGETAQDWCYLGGDPDELLDGTLRYSTKREFYKPMCRACHRRYDNGETCEKGHADWTVRSDGKRRCRLCYNEWQRVYRAERRTA
ncbi:MAG: hypothetical protein ACOYB3_01900 [Azonexus sp.]